MILENVSSLLSHNGGATFATIKERLEGVGYTVSHNVLKASDYGIPQMRKRFSLFAHAMGYQKSICSYHTFLLQHFQNAWVGILMKKMWRILYAVVDGDQVCMTVITGIHT